MLNGRTPSPRRSGPACPCRSGAKERVGDGFFNPRLHAPVLFRACFTIEKVSCMRQRHGRRQLNFPAATISSFSRTLLGEKSLGVYRIGPDRQLKRLDADGEAKTQIRKRSERVSAGVDPEIMRGRGHAAAAARRILADRGGFIGTERELAAWQGRAKHITAAKCIIPPPRKTSTSWPGWA